MKRLAILALLCGCATTEPPRLPFDEAMAKILLGLAPFALMQRPMMPGMERGILGSDSRENTTTQNAPNAPPAAPPLAEPEKPRPQFKTEWRI